MLLLAGTVVTVPAIAQRSGADATPRPVTPRGALDADEQRTIELFQRARESVVYIDTRERVLDPWTRNIFSLPRGTGSGFVWDDRGHVVSNFHVVAGASEAVVRLADGRDSPATLIGASADHDLAVLRLRLQSLPPAVAIGSSHDLRVGQKVFAIGNPFGLDRTLTTGIISALDRSLPAQDGRTQIEHLIQTDAAINPGNSGGPLLDSAGRLIGVNTAIFSPSGASAGIGFAVPIDTVNRVVPQLIAHGKYVRPEIGIATDEALNDAITGRLGVRGVAVLRVTPGSPAANAGLRGVQILRDGTLVPGDIIVAVDGREVDGVARFLARLDDYEVGNVIRLRVRREGQVIDMMVTLAAGA